MDCQINSIIEQPDFKYHFKCLTNFGPASLQGFFMSRYYSYIRTAQQLISSYDGSLPFAPFAKVFFAKEKKYGATDRKQISALCYHYFRTAKASGNMPEEEKLMAATFLCEANPTRLLEVLKPEWNAIIHLPVKEKMQLLGNDFREEKLFPFTQYLSAKIDQQNFRLSFLIQPDLFLRIRPGYEKIVTQKLTAQSIAYTPQNNHCIMLPNGSKIEDAIQLNKEAVVQDINSQKTGEVIQQYVLKHLLEINCWDCCAASGGKSMMLHDLQQHINLTVSDVRPSILHNLRQRFQEAGIQNYQSFTADVLKSDITFPGRKLFNMILADVPCTGSGTWARTPEQSYFFNEKEIEKYTSRQKQIVTNVLPFLTNDGYLVYITCSVFTAENESIVEYLQAQGLQIVHLQYLKGYLIKADTLFIAVLQRTLQHS